ncbi:hypothetical protein BH11BAC5_BH11BAC5_54990 [soil metagenome]
MVEPTYAVATTLETKFEIKVSNNTIPFIDARAGFNMGDKQALFRELKDVDTLVLKGI